MHCRKNNNHESSNVRKHPEIVVNLHQANDTLIPLKKDIKRIVPGNPSYADISRLRKKLVIVGDSICRPIDMADFEGNLERGESRKRYFRGATVSQIHHYIDAVLEEDAPDRIILCMGTNNFTKKQQSAVDTATEILNLVHKCHLKGVSEVYVSGITVRLRYQK